MKTASEEILGKLRDSGCRITKARTEVVEALLRIHSPITVQALAESVSVDEVSVYRTIALLVQEGFVEEIRMHGDTARYALSHGHHHHVACTSCDTVVHIDCGGEPKLPAQVKGFSKITSHELTFYGLCKKCA